MGNSNHCNNDFLYSSVHRRLLPVGIVSHSARLPRPEVRSAPCILNEGPGAARARRRNFGGNHLDRLGPSPRHPRRARLQVTTTAMKIGLFFAKKWAIIGIFFFILVFSVQFFKSPMTGFEARTYYTRKESIMIWCWKSSLADHGRVITSRADPVKNVSHVKIRYDCFQLYDWRKILAQNI